MSETEPEMWRHGIDNCKRGRGWGCGDSRRKGKGLVKEHV